MGTLYCCLGKTSVVKLPHLGHGNDVGSCAILTYCIYKRASPLSPAQRTWTLQSQRAAAAELAADTLCSSIEVLAVSGTVLPLYVLQSCQPAWALA